ncbi:nicotinate-nicotinamide nucleotide adenylyltransferase [Candidatus Uhrbacteria bacterium]|nr:nicotinate-nicotinamide nucleotide adenylyltransferase [Candidatus Uhrbacteria bacterium]
MASTIRIGIGGSAANPPHLGHVAMVRAVLDSERFDAVCWAVSGARADKPDVALPDDRIAMTLLTFPSQKLLAAGGSRLILRFDDAYGENVPTIRRIEALHAAHPDAELAWFTGVDVLVPQPRYGGRSEVAAAWVDGERLLAEWPLVVLPRAGYPNPRELDLPAGCTVIDADLPRASSSDIRRKIAANDWSYVPHLTGGVRAYIRERALYGYRGTK